MDGVAAAPSRSMDGAPLASDVWRYVTFGIMCALALVMIVVTWITEAVLRSQATTAPVTRHVKTHDSAHHAIAPGHAEEIGQVEVSVLITVLSLLWVAHAAVEAFSPANTMVGAWLRTLSGAAVNVSLVLTAAANCGVQDLNTLILLSVMAAVLSFGEINTRFLWAMLAVVAFLVVLSYSLATGPGTDRSNMPLGVPVSIIIFLALAYVFDQPALYTTGSMFQLPSLLRTGNTREGFRLGTRVALAVSALVGIALADRRAD
jgi:hypothetical protein